MLEAGGQTTTNAHIRELEAGGSGEEATDVYADIEKSKEECNTHRCTADQYSAFIAHS